MNETVKLKETVNWPKRIGISLIVAILIIGGTVITLIALNSTPKNKYFHAEGNSLEFMKDVFNERYEPELKWREDSMEKAVRSSFELSPQYDDPSSDFDMFNPASFINHSTITFTTERDVKDKKLSAKLNANLGEIEVGDVEFYATNEKLQFGLPFLQETLLLHGDDIGTVLHNLDPEVDPDTEFDLNVLFDRAAKLITDEQKEYIEKEYFDMIYEKLDDEFFTSTKETVEVNNESIKVEKIELQLSETELKNLFEVVIEKMSKDEVLKEIIRDLIIQQVDLGMSFAPVPPELAQEVDQLMDGYEDALQEVKNEIDLMVFKDGITSTLWIQKGLIVKRLFQMEIGMNENDLVELKVDGTQSLAKNDQLFDYDVIVSDEFMEVKVNLAASFSNDDGETTDSIIIAFDEAQVSYHGKETLADKTREFERSFMFEDDFSEPIGLIWSGNATYDRDKMNSDHQFTLELDDLTDETFSLQVAKSSELIKEVELPDGEIVKDLGVMSDQELFEYIEYDIPEQFQQWIFGVLGGANLLEF